MRIAVLDHSGYFSLVPYLNEIIGANDSVKNIKHAWKPEGISELRRFKPDVVLAEFCAQNAVAAAKLVRTLPHRPKLVIRLHGYESEDSHLKRIDIWKNVSCLVTVSPWFKQLLQGKVGDKVNVRMIMNGIDLKKFTIKNIDVDNSSVAVLGFINRKKGPALMRCVFESFPERNFHIAGTFQDETAKRLFSDAKDRLKNVTWYPWLKSADFLPGKRWILNTSLTESFSMAVAEGMACGLTPLVHWWPGADLLWPKKCIWSTIDQIRKIEPMTRIECRDWIVKRYNIRRCAAEFLKLLKS